MVGWHHRLNRLEFEQAPGDGERQGSLACCSPWDHKESDMNERLNNNCNETGELPGRCLSSPEFPREGAGTPGGANQWLGLSTFKF